MFRFFIFGDMPLLSFCDHSEGWFSSLFPLRSEITLHLAYNIQSTVVHAYEIALSELLIILDAVEGYEFNFDKDAWSSGLGELEEKAIQAPGVGEGRGEIWRADR